MATKKTTKKATAKKPSAKKAAARRPKALKTQHARLTREQEAFMTFRARRETMYWLIFGLVAILFTLWITRLQSDVQAIYDQIDIVMAQESSLTK